MLCRTIAIPIVHFMDAAEKGDFGAIERWQIVGICLQGVRIAIPAAALCFVPSSVVTGVLNAMPAWLSGGMTVGGGMVLCRWLCNGYKHDGYKGNLAILRFRFRICLCK